ncbi:hypothetical protein P692DRAFT_20519832 [Suillus brevipes Sb2]|nr:hypothetical protein P692DRAFT_20519832 [Suillus brevipes Sb2]
MLGSSIPWFTTLHILILHTTDLLNCLLEEDCQTHYSASIGITTVQPLSWPRPFCSPVSSEKISCNIQNRDPSRFVRCLWDHYCAVFCRDSLLRHVEHLWS